MSRFDALGSAYLAEPLLHVMGERVIVHVSGESPRSVLAEVRRELPDLIDSRPSGVPTPRASLTFRNHPTKGLCAKDIDRGTLEVEFSVDAPGGTISRRRVLDFETVVGGMLTVYVS